MILSQSNEDVQKEARIVDVMIRNRVDGVIVSITKNTIDMAPFLKFRSVGIPVVFMTREPRGATFDFVSSDSFGGAVAATEFLLKRGHRRIAHLRGPESMRTGQVRFEGYLQALEKQGIPYDPQLVKAVDFTTDATFSAMDAFMQLPDPPTAVFTFKNYITLDAINYLKIRHPELLDKIEFAGFGNLPILHHLDHKPLASIEENSYEMGLEAANILFERIGSDAGTEAACKTVRFPCKLVIHT